MLEGVHIWRVKAGGMLAAKSEREQFCSDFSSLYCEVGKIVNVFRVMGARVK